MVLGDGECNEGSVWEAAQFAAYFQLDNLVAVVDHNQMQSLDRCDKTLSSVPLADTWRGFGWNVLEADGNDHDSLRAAFAAVPQKREAHGPCGQNGQREGDILYGDGHFVALPLSS